MGLVLAVTAAASCTAREPEPAPPPPQGSTGVTGDAIVPELDVRLVRVTGKRAPTGTVRLRDLKEPAQAIREEIEDLYVTAYLDPASEDAALLGHFSGEAREEVRQHVDRLTLGAAAEVVDEVRPRRAVLKLEFVEDRGGRPVVAFAEVDFEATAVAGEEDARVKNRAEYVLRRINGAWRIVSYEVRSRVPTPEQLRSQRREVSFAPGVPSHGPMFVLVIGSDARPGQSVTRTRADSIHIVGVNPRLGRASILGIPRDSWVSIPGSGADKINAALVRGGPDLLVRTVESLSGIPIDAYVLTGFAGFIRIVRAVGGFDIRIGTPIHDSFAHAQFGRGPEHLSGSEALALSRARHDVRGGDFGRSLNQGRVMIAALATLREELRRGRPALLSWLLAGMRHLETDLDVGGMFELILSAPSFEPARIRNAVATGGSGFVGGKSVVFLDAGARALFRDLARDGVLDE